MLSDQQHLLQTETNTNTKTKGWQIDRQTVLWLSILTLYVMFSHLSSTEALRTGKCVSAREAALTKIGTKDSRATPAASAAALSSSLTSISLVKSTSSQ